jgi:hypothetical protein
MENISGESATADVIGDHKHIGYKLIIRTMMQFLYGIIKELL